MKTPADKASNAPIEKALVLLREDLTLQISTGEHALEVHLNADMAYGLARALLANIGGNAPWAGRDDARVLEYTHDLAFSAARLVSLALAVPALTGEKQALLARELERAFAAVALLDVALITFDSEEKNAEPQT
jgi:hypothetical protein